MDKYSSVGISVGSYTEKGSSFSAKLFPVRSIYEIKSKLNQLKKKYQDASHICYAYRIKKDDRLDEYSSDAGEPKGSAGIPILNLLKRRNLVNSVIYVIRYFGGSKLGISGIIHAYGAAAEDAIEHATLQPWFQQCILSLIYQYEVQNKVESVLKQYDVIVIQQHFKESIETSIEVRKSIHQELILRLEKITNGTIYIKK